MKAVIKKWIDGSFQEVKVYSIDDIKMIRHHQDGIELVFNGYIKLFDKQCIIEFKN